MVKSEIENKYHVKTVGESDGYEVEMEFDTPHDLPTILKTILDHIDEAEKFTKIMIGKIGDETDEQ